MVSDLVKERQCRLSNELHSLYQVAGIVGRAELLASMLFLLTIMAYRKCLVAMHTEGKDAYKQGQLVCKHTLQIHLNTEALWCCGHMASHHYNSVGSTPQVATVQTSQ